MPNIRSHQSYVQEEIAAYRRAKQAATPPLNTVRLKEADMGAYVARAPARRSAMSRSPRVRKQTEVGYEFVPFPAEALDARPFPSYAELTVLLYILRHSKRYLEPVTPIMSTAHFLRGRFRKRVGTSPPRKLDEGCGLASKNSVKAGRAGLRKRGWILEHRDPSDGGREKIRFEPRFGSSESSSLPAPEPWFGTADVTTTPSAGATFVATIWPDGRVAWSVKNRPPGHPVPAHPRVTSSPPYSMERSFGESSSEKASLPSGQGRDPSPEGPAERGKYPDASAADDLTAVRRSELVRIDRQRAIRA